ncbi:MAG TPA: ABC transporter ATP-binding protein, partial [Burkholderiales bacterium]|nr:ABC transporter ATP-binding protein [Burkholderiales bacterium]
MIEFQNVSKWFGSFQVLSDIDLEVSNGEKIVVCGPSGSGKSTLIRCVNALEPYQKGRITVAGTELTGDIKSTYQVRTHVGMVFQSFNLFPHISVLENLTLAPIRVSGVPEDQAKREAMVQLERVKIAEQAEKYPGQLSGGQQQRVAIARALCMKPDVLLFDEPT